MVVQNYRPWRIFGIVVLFFDLLTLQACKRSAHADQVLYACFNRPGDLRESLVRIREISDRFDYSLREYGKQAKSDLETINANPAVIPKGQPIQADIRNQNNDVVAIFSNFGGNGETLRVSFFDSRNKIHGSPFYQELVSSLKAMGSAQLKISADGTDINPCVKS